MLVWLPLQDGATVITGVTATDGAFLGGSGGILQIAGDAARPLLGFLGVQDGAYGAPGPTVVRPYAVAMARDASGNVWAAGSRRLGSYGFEGYGSFVMFPGAESAWEKAEAAGNPDAPLVPRLLRWRAPFEAMAGDPRGVGLWVYGARDDGVTDLCHVGADFPSPFPREDPPSAVPAGATVPAVADPNLAAGTDGRVWLAGDTLDGSRVYVFDGKAFDEVTPPDDLLKSRRFTQLGVSTSGELYTATDGVGVLVYDGKAWSAHPVNADLPALEGSDLKPVSCMTLDADENLWVGTDNNVICWRPEQP